MPLGQCMRQHTDRELAVWLKWLGDQWNKPSRGDHYLMQLDCTVKRLLAEHPDRVQLKDSQLRFESPPLAETMTPEELAADDKREAMWSHMRWHTAMGVDLNELHGKTKNGSKEKPK